METLFTFHLVIREGMVSNHDSLIQVYHSRYPMKRKYCYAYIITTYMLALAYAIQAIERFSQATV